MSKWELPAPPSANVIWRHNRGRVHRSKEYLDWLDASSWIVCVPVPECLTGDVRLDITVRPKDGRIRDLDNYTKPICDLLERCRVYKNDNQVTEIHMYRMKPNGGMHDLLVEVTSLVPAASLPS